MNTLPLCVDLDGTLLKTDTLHELVVRVLKCQPWVVFLLPLWLLRGKHVLKRELSSRCRLEPSLLPYNTQCLAFLREQHAAGRALYLATGAYRDVAQSVADHLRLFAGVFATTDDSGNLTGQRKATLLVEKFGAKGFDYAGNDVVDEAVWQHANAAYLVNATPAVRERVSRTQVFAAEMDSRSPLSLKLLLKTVRVHQWAKNALIFVPILASHHLLDAWRLFGSVQAFLAFCCCASFSYVLNDISDLDADRRHHSKHHRPFASGQVSIPTGFVIAIMLLALTVLLASGLPRGVVACLLVYFLVTNAYTLRLKQIPVLDVAILAGLYTLRVMAGGYAAQAPTTFWLLAFSGFIFFSLAIVKRLSELLNIETPDEQPVICRGYWTNDIPVLTGLGTASAMMAVLVLALYINSPDIMALYSSPRYLWLVCPVVALWLGRVWLITGRGQMHDDPVVFALRDRASWCLFGVAALFMIIGAEF